MSTNPALHAYFVGCLSDAFCLRYELLDLSISCTGLKSGVCSSWIQALAKLFGRAGAQNFQIFSRPFERAICGHVDRSLFVFTVNLFFGTS